MGSGGASSKRNKATGGGAAVPTVTGSFQHQLLDQLEAQGYKVSLRDHFDAEQGFLRESITLTKDGEQITAYPHSYGYGIWDISVGADVRPKAFQQASSGTLKASSLNKLSNNERGVALESMPKGTRVSRTVKGTQKEYTKNSSGNWELSGAKRTTTLRTSEIYKSRFNTVKYPKRAGK